MLTDEQGEEGLTGGHGGAGDEGRKWGRTKLIEAGEEWSEFHGPRVRRGELKGLNVAAWQMVEQQNLPDRQRPGGGGPRGASPADAR